MKWHIVCYLNVLNLFLHEEATKESKMKKMRRFVGSKFPIILCFTFFLTISDFPGTSTQAKDAKFPIGEVISRGGVRFEARENVWKSIDSSHFPVFEKGKILAWRSNAGFPDSGSTYENILPAERNEK
jgi:hypothetical protein